MTQRFQVNLGGIIELLSAHLYSGPHVYVRELLQNAVDALTARTKLNGAGDPAWRVTFRNEGSALLVDDDGIGLTADEFERFLATIGESSKRGVEAAREELLGQFGIGLLSCFLIADEIEVTSRSARTADAPTVRWVGRIDGTYSLSTLSTRRDIGTTVKLVPRAGMESWTEPKRVEELSTRFGQLLPWPVFVSRGKSLHAINPEPAPWHRDLAPGELRSALRRFGDKLIGRPIFEAVPLKSTIGGIDGVAFILREERTVPKRRGDRVYLKGMLIGDDVPGLLPDWAFFVKGVLNGVSLRPTASREGLYADQALTDAQEELGSQLRTWLMDLARNDAERAAELIELHHLGIKQLAADDEEFREVIFDALPFETSHGFLTVAEIRELAQEQSLSLKFTENRDTFRQLAPIARGVGTLLMNAGYVFDTKLLQDASELGLHVSVVELADFTRDLEDAGTETFATLADEALEELDVEVSVKAFTPPGLPSLFLASTAATLRAAIERSKEAEPGDAWGGVLDDLAAPLKGARPKLLLNANSPFVKALMELAEQPSSEDQAASAVRVLYVQALLLASQPLTARELGLLNEGLTDLVRASLPTRSKH